MATAIFISEAYLKDSSIINENVDPKVLLPNIKIAQDIYIQPVLGTQLYLAMATKVNASSVTGVYKTLMDDYIQPALREWTIYESGPDILFRFMNKAITTNSGENSQPIDKVTMDAILERFKNRAEWYCKRLQQFLCANSTDYPEYNNNPNADDIQSQADTFTSPMYLGEGDDCNDAYVNDMKALATLHTNYGG